VQTSVAEYKMNLNLLFRLHVAVLRGNSNVSRRGASLQQAVVVPLGNIQRNAVDWAMMANA